MLVVRLVKTAIKYDLKITRVGTVRSAAGPECLPGGPAPQTRGQGSEELHVAAGQSMDLNDLYLSL